MSDTPDTPQRIDLIDELRWRGLLHQCTDEDGLRAHLADPENAPRKIYSGFDPTADSLTIGNLVPIMLLAHVKRAGHIAVVLQGGGTGLIGDPSGKSAERQLNTAETVAANVKAQTPIFDAVLGKVPGPAHTIVNNLDWLGGLSYIEALRDVGKHFSVNMMMQKESVKARLEEREQGISYTEFSYMILQAYDFWHLYKHQNVTVQIGGSDQFGNIVAGVDLVRRRRNEAIQSEISWLADVDYLEKILEHIDDPECSTEIKLAYKQYESTTGPSSDELERVVALIEMEASDEISAMIETRRQLKEHAEIQTSESSPQTAFGITAPLVTKADGTKFGKTESGAVWLTAPKPSDSPEQLAKRTSPYAYYQFWLNATDEDAAKWVKVFTFLDGKTIKELLAAHAENPGKRELQRTLAREATAILHGDDARDRAEAAGKALFSGEIGGLDESTLAEVFADVPSSEHASADLDGEGVDPVELLKAAGLASSNREAREFLGNGSVSINGDKIDAETRLSRDHLLHGSVMAIRRGKKKWHLARWR